MNNLGAIAQAFGCSISAGEELIPKGVAINSAHVRDDYLFIAVRGAKDHGLKYLDEAIQKGAVALLTDTPGEYPIPSLIHSNPRVIAGEIAKTIFQTPEKGLYAITGTNGKTSTVFYLKRILDELGEATGLISSAEQIVGATITQAELTTPEAPRVHQLLAQMRSAGQMSAAVEVSAQALVRNRIDGLKFTAAGFTNLSRDHLDDFGSMEKYFESKAQLFTAGFASLAVINVEDSWGKLLFEQVLIPKVGIGPGYEYQAEYKNGKLQISGKASLEIDFKFGELMAKNLAVAIVLLLESGYQAKAIGSAVSRIDQQIPGRLQLVSDRYPHVYVDYAHTPAGVSAAVREIAGRYRDFTVIIAASGNRDVGKREEMGLACSGAKRIIVTDQHPRDEDPAVIRQQLLSAARTLGSQVEEVADPTAAIARAVEIAPSDSAILWCGPGQLPYREVRGEKIPFSALDVARRAVEGD